MRAKMKTSAGTWASGIVLGVASCAVAASAFTLAMGNILESSNPNLALRFDAGNPVALTKAADASLFGSLPEKLESKSLSEAAHQSLSDTLINAPALRLLAFARDIDGNESGATQLMQASAQLTRRDFKTRLWLIERYAATGDAKEALRQYDLALRTSSQAPDVLYPILAQALTDRGLWPDFAPYLRSRPEWLPYFLTYAVREGPAPEVIAILLLKYGGPDISSIETDLYGRLLATNRFDLARAFYLSRPTSNRNALLSASFDDAGIRARFVPITWHLLPRADLDVSWVEGAQAGQSVMDISASTGASGTIARKFLNLAPGSYRIGLKLADGDGNAAAISWQMICAIDGRRLGGGGVRPAAAVVPSGCAYQYLDLLLPSGGLEKSESYELNDVTIVRSTAS